MPLIDFKTDLTNLPWGRDRRDGGSSNEPYNKTDIPQGLSSDNLPNNSPDFILRNGLRGITTAAEDVGRLTKMFFDTKSPKGLQFTTKQNLLSRTSVKTQASKGPAYGGGVVNQGIYNPLNTIAQAGLVATGGHLKFLGIDGSVKTGTDEGGGIVENLLSNIGVDTSLGINTYSSVVKNNQPSDDNRLVDFYEYRQKVSLGQTGTPLYSYQGGPGSVLGVGKTNISFADQRTGINNTHGPSIRNKEWLVGNTYRTVEIDYSKLLTTGSSADYGLTLGDNGINENGQILYTNTTDTPYTYTQEQLNQKATSVKGDDQGQYPSDFRDILQPNVFQPETVISLSPDYKTKNVDVRTFRGNPGAKNSVLNYGLPANELEALDKITASPMYEYTGPRPDRYALNDLCKFRIAAIDNDRTDGTAIYIHFRAFLDNFDDNFNATWNAVNYVGRGDTLYNYSGYTRTVSLGFTAFAQSKAELIPMYKKLNYLASTLTPDYNQAGFMRGNLLRLTVGGYLYETPGFITNLTYNVPQESPWEIAINENGDSDSSVKELPHMIKCSFSFTPIHKFLPQKPNDPNNPSSEHYISLANGLGDAKNNYGDKYRTYNNVKPSPPIESQQAEELTTETPTLLGQRETELIYSRPVQPLETEPPKLFGQ
jgi:hypothetical protein